MPDNIEQLNKLAQIFNADKIITPKDIETILGGIMKIMASFKTAGETMSADSKKYVDSSIASLTKQVKKISDQITTDSEADKKEMSDMIDGKVADIKALRDEVLAMKPENGQDADEERVITGVLEKIKLPEYKPTILDTPEEMANKLESLTGDARLSIEAIKGLEEKLKAMFPVTYTRMNTVGGGVQSIVAGSGISIVSSGAKGKGVVTITATGSGGAWGTITGTLSAQTDLQTALNAKQNLITTGTTSQYFRGDLSLATFPTNVSTFTNDANYTTLSAVAGVGYLTSLSGAWLLNGNTLGAKKTLGSIDNYDIGFLTNNTERMTILANGNVGIGTTNPLHYLDITKTAENQRTVFGNNVSMTASTLQQDTTATGNDETLTNQYYAFPFTASASHTVGSWAVRLKKVGTVTNTTDYILLKIYSDNAGVPNTLLATTDSVRMGTLTTSYVSYLFGADLTLVSGTTYWIAVNRSAAVTGGGSIAIDRNGTALTTATVAVPASGDWTVNAGLGRYVIYGQSPKAIYGNSTNSVGIYGNSTNSYGIYGNSTNSIGGIFYQSGTLTTANATNAVIIRRYGVTNSVGSLNYSGNLLQLTDNPTGTGTVTGSLINGSIDGTVRLDFNPRVADGASAVAYMLDTKNTLANASSKLFELRNGGTASLTVLGNGNVGIGTTSPNANALLDITSTTKAFMPPRATTTQIASVSTPTEGMVMFDITLHKLSYYNGTAWLVV